MPEVYLASSALISEDFDGNRTIEEAQKAGFKGVQLFLDPKYRDRNYLESVLISLETSELGLVLHLPNIVEEDAQVAERIVKEYPETKVLVHYLPATELPVIEGTTVGWENSKIGPLSEDMVEHLQKVKDKVFKDNTFYVYDMGRQLYASDESEVQRTIEFIRAEIRALDPKKDVIHLADKTSWILKFRDSMCALGDGIMKEFIDDINNFQGPIVFEHENLEMALKSLEVIKQNNTSS